MRFIGKYIVIPFLLMLAVIFFFLTETTLGLRIGIQMLADALPGQLHVKHVQGALFSTFSLKNISYQSPSEKITLDSMTVTWSPKDLLRKKLVIQDIQLSQGEILIQSDSLSTSNASSFSIDTFLSYLQYIRIYHFSLNHFVIKKDPFIIYINGKQINPYQPPIIDSTWIAKNIAIKQQKMKQLQGHAHLILAKGKNSFIDVTASGIQLQSTQLKPFNLHLKSRVYFMNDALSSQSEIAFNNTPIITALLTLSKLTSISNEDFPMTGKIHLQFSQFNLLTPLIPNINQITGMIIGNGIITGTLKQPILNLTLEGKKLVIANLPEYTVTISPQITLEYAKQQLFLRGSIFIPSAHIFPNQFDSTVTLPEDVVFVNQSSSSPSFSFEKTLNLSIQLGNDIQVNDNNLTAQLAGHLILNQLPGSPMTGTGELHTTQGQYRTYGTVLNIQYGRLIFTGNIITNPGLDIRAMRKIRTVQTTQVTSFAPSTSPLYAGTTDIHVGAQITGSARHPIIKLISDPSGLSQGDILSYLLLGYPQSQAMGQQGTALLSALSSLNSNTNQPHLTDITNEIEQKLGFSELNIGSIQTFNPATSSIESTTSFIIGKQITSQLSLHYSIGLFNPISIFHVRYQITPHWAIQSETSTIDNGADLLYEFERDP